MWKMSGILGVIVLACGAKGWAADSTPAKPNATIDSSRFSTADRDVHDALAAELTGDNARRAELLSQALEDDPNCKTARWQAGFVKLDGAWITPQDAEQKFSSDPKLGEYRQKRDQDAAAGFFSRGNVYAAATTGARNARLTRSSSVENFSSSGLSPAGLKAHVDLAHWCRANHLTDEERAHWTQVLLNDPSNSEAQSRLGMQFYMGSLATHAQIDTAKKQHATEDKQLAEWKPIVVRLRTALNGGNESERTDAAAEIARITGPAVIPALEWAIHTDPASHASAKRDAATPFQRQAIATLGRITEQRATYSLAGLGVFASQAEIRRLATDELKKRPLHDFVPTLLAGLANPIRFDYAMAFDRNEGTAAYRAVASQEGRDTIRQVQYSSTASGLPPNVTGGLNDGAGLFATTDSTARRSSAETSRDAGPRNSLSGPRNWTQVPGALALARQSALLETSFQNQNARIAQTNERINSVLEGVALKKSSDSTDDTANDGSDAIPDAALAKSAPSTANYWWNWWADYTESQTTDKEVSITRYANSSSYNRNLYPQRISATSATPSTGRTSFVSSAECFAAGTPVVTLTGPVAINKVQIGDRVLAQDADTGELAYKPVLGTTLRPPTDMVLVTTPDGAVRATRGHPFWIVGKGWRMAKELSVGDRVHGLHGSSTVTALERQPAEPAYNLVVADFGTYFVGAGQILAHDSTARLPTTAAVPGMGGQSR
jgi:hypothetical protein